MALVGPARASWQAHHDQGRQERDRDREGEDTGQAEVSTEYGSSACMKTMAIAISAP
jgi:hypothetical protein